MKLRLEKSRKSKVDELWKRADQHDRRGNLRSAFRLLLAAAKAGDRNAQNQVGYFYDTGRGVRPNRPAALYWYKRAYRRGDPLAAHNIGTIWRDQHKVQRAAAWFQRAVDPGSDDSNLDIAKLYLDQDDPSKAISYLNLVLHSSPGWEPDKKEARRLLRQAMGKLKRP